MGGKKSVKKNYIYNSIYQVLTLLTPLITMPYVSRVLRADGIGTFSFAGSIVNYFVLFASMGIAAYGRREVSYYQDDRAKRSMIFWNLKCLAAINVAVCLTLYLTLTEIFSGANFTIYLILSMNILSVFLDVIWFLNGVEDFGKVVIKDTAVRIVHIVFIFTFVKTKADLPIYVFSSVFFPLLGNALMWSFLPKYIDKPDFKSLKPFQDIRVIWMLFVPAIAVEVYTVLDKTMIGIITEGTFENGYYEQALKVARVTLSLITSLGLVVGPRVGYLFFNNRREEISHYLYTSYRFVWCIGIPMCLGMIGISDNFVPWFFGRGFEKVASLIKISSFLILAVGINSTTASQYLIPTKRHNIFTMAVVVGAAVNFTLNIFFIRMFQSYGAIAASVIAETVIALLEIYIVRREISLTKIILCGKNYYAAGIVMLAVVYMTGKKLAPSLVSTFAMIFEGAFVYMLMLLVLRDWFFIDNVKKALAAIKKRLHI